MNVGNDVSTPGRGPATPETLDPPKSLCLAFYFPPLCEVRKCSSWSWPQGGTNDTSVLPEPIAQAFLILSQESRSLGRRRLTTFRNVFQFFSQIKNSFFSLSGITPNFPSCSLSQFCCGNNDPRVLLPQLGQSDPIWDQVGNRND